MQTLHSRDSKMTIKQSKRRLFTNEKLNKKNPGDNSKNWKEQMADKLIDMTT